MKKTRKALLSLILSAAMVIAMLPGMSMVAKAVPAYTVTVQNGTADKSSAAEGETVTITANDNIEFLGWGAMTQADVNLLADDSAKTTTFTMPARDIFFAAMTPSGGAGNEGGSSNTETHTHDWIYTDLGNGVLRAECTYEGCEVRPTLTIVAPELSRTGSGSAEATLSPDQLWTDNDNSLPTDFTINYANFANGEHCDSAPTTAGTYIAAASAPHPKYNNQTILVSLTYTISASSTSGDSDPGSGAADEGGSGGDSGQGGEQGSGEGQETPTGGLFTGRYSKYQVFDVQRSPAFPRSGSAFTVRGLRQPNVGGLEITENGWFYFKPVGNGSTTQRWELTTGQTPYIVELWYNNGSTDIKINDGVIGGLSSEGFLYVANSTGNGYFFSNSAGYDYNYTGTISYTPSVITVCDATTLTSYTPGSMLTPSQTNETNSSTISAATTTLAAGDYTLESDVVLTNGLKITSGDVNINLNGHTLSVADNANNGVIYVAGGNVTVSNGTISGGQGNPEIRAASDGKTRGGGVAVHAGVVTLNNVVIKDNKANWGGGVYLEGDSTVILNNCEITNNDSIEDSDGWNAGGGIFVDDNGIVRLNNTKVTGNKSSNGHWPGISIAENAIIEVSGNTIVYDNKIGSVQQNLSITSPCIKVVGELGATAKIGVRKDSGVITCTGSDKTSLNDATKFVNDNANGGIAKDSSGQLALTDSAPSEEEQAEEPSNDSKKSTAVINLPEPEKTSVKNDEPVVKGLAEAAADEGDDVSLNMVITAEPETALEDNTTLNNNTDIKEEIKGQFKDETSVRVDVLTIDIRKLISGVFTGDLVASTSTILEIGIGYDFANKYDPSLVSKHGNVVKAYATLTARPKVGNYRNGTFFADVANNIFYIYSRDFSDFVISYSTVEGNAQNRSVIDPNATASAESVSYAPKTIPVYRLFNKVSGNHLFTVNKEERDILVSKGWDDEGIAWQVVASTNTPVYRLFDAAGNGDHFYTASDAVKAELIAKGCVDEGIAWYGQSTTGRTVYKVTNTKYGKSVLTTFVEEKDALVAAGFAAEEADFKVN